MNSIDRPDIASREEWIEARIELLDEEKALTRRRDKLNARRREMPWVRLDKTYEFDTPVGRKTLADLFAGRSQLIVQHFMFAPDWEAGCTGCSFVADHVDAAWTHLRQHDVTYVAIARASVEKLQAYWQRMDWRFGFASSLNSEFNYDFNVSFTEQQMASGRVYYNFEMIAASIEELPGASVFYRDADGAVYHTYSVYGRGNEEVLGAYMLLDITPGGRNETGPNYNLMDWVRRHDEYEYEEPVDQCCKR